MRVHGSLRACSRGASVCLMLCLHTSHIALHICNVQIFVHTYAIAACLVIRSTLLHMHTHTHKFYNTQSHSKLHQSVVNFAYCMDRDFLVNLCLNIVGIRGQWITLGICELVIYKEIYVIDLVQMLF